MEFSSETSQLFFHFVPSLAFSPMANKSSRDRLLQWLKGQHRFVPFSEVQAEHPLFDQMLPRLREDRFLEFSVLNTPQASALKEYSVKVSSFFPSSVLPKLVPFDVASMFGAAAGSEWSTQTAASEEAVVPRDELEAASTKARTAAASLVECVRFNYHHYTNDPAVDRGRRRKEVVAEICRCLARRRQPLTLADIWLHLGLDICTDGPLLDELRKHSHYDGRTQSFGIGLVHRAFFMSGVMNFHFSYFQSLYFELFSIFSRFQFQQSLGKLGIYFKVSFL